MIPLQILELCLPAQGINGLRKDFDAPLKFIRWHIFICSMRYADVARSQDDWRRRRVQSSERPRCQTRPFPLAYP